MLEGFDSGAVDYIVKPCSMRLLETRMCLRLRKGEDGKIEVVMIKQVEKPNFFQKIGAVFTVAKLFMFGYNAKGKRIAHMKGSSFDVQVSKALTWNFDGEKGCSGEIHIEVVPKKVNMIIPKKTKHI